MYFMIFDTWPDNIYSLARLRWKVKWSKHLQLLQIKNLLRKNVHLKWSLNYIRNGLCSIYGHSTHWYILKRPKTNEYFRYAARWPNFIRSVQSKPTCIFISFWLQWLNKWVSVPCNLSSIFSFEKAKKVKNDRGQFGQAYKTASRSRFNKKDEI